MNVIINKVSYTEERAIKLGLIKSGVKNTAKSKERQIKLKKIRAEEKAKEKASHQEKVQNEIVKK